MKFTIKDKIPSKKNNRNIFIRSGRIVNIPSNDYQTWHKQASLQLKSQGANLITDISSVTLAFWWPDKRRRDLTNVAESIMDLLVDNKIIVDDCWKITGDIFLFSMGIDKKIPRCEILIEVNNEKET